MVILMALQQKVPALIAALGGLLLWAAIGHAEAPSSVEQGRDFAGPAEESQQPQSPIGAAPAGDSAESNTFSSWFQRDFDTSPPVSAELGVPGDSPPSPATAPGGWWSQFRVGGYDSAQNNFLLVQPIDAEARPFELRFDLYMQLRYSSFGRSAANWTQTTGATLPVQDFSIFEIN
jgi:hypothetical protein